MCFYILQTVVSDASGLVVMPAIPSSEDIRCIHINVDTDEPMFTLSSIFADICIHQESSSSSSASSSYGKSCLRTCFFF